ncbi:MAG TPA: hypothetical protein P5136_01360 [Methanofastidiosum sp.]|nr:hypothetical protein [Methanofastidiosum sp.]
MKEIREKLIVECSRNCKEIDEIQTRERELQEENRKINIQFVSTAKYKIDQIIAVKNQTDAYIYQITSDLGLYSFRNNTMNGNLKYHLKCITMSGAKGEKHHSTLTEEDLDKKIEEGEYKLVDKVTSRQFKKAVYANWPKVLEPLEVQVIKESPEKDQGSVQFLITVNANGEKRYFIVETSKSSWDYIHPRVSKEMEGKYGYSPKKWHIRVFSNSNGEPCFKIYKFCSKKFSEETWRNFTFLCVAEEDILEYCIKAV